MLRAFFAQPNYACIGMQIRFIFNFILFFIVFFTSQRKTESDAEFEFHRLSHNDYQSNLHRPEKFLVLKDCPLHRTCVMQVHHQVLLCYLIVFYSLVEHEQYDNSFCLNQRVHHC